MMQFTDQEGLSILHPFALRDVPEDGGHSKHPPTAVAHPGCGDGYVNQRSILSASYALKRHAALGHGCREDPCLILELALSVGRKDEAHRPTNSFLFGVAEHR